MRFSHIDGWKNRVQQAPNAIAHAAIFTEVSRTVRRARVTQAAPGGGVTQTMAIVYVRRKRSA